MPHINRIRVNNVKYNFGTQFYDDFMMRFSCKNTIYDLANGGGKSVLMLLLLQNLIPNCTLDEKQPVEKLFRTASGSNTIHSLIEWKLDSCYRRENFKYMTTGFCARKGKDSGENVDRESANIEYFNYCIFYREFGDNDIKNLPLSKDGERITYNGLKSYLRDLEKKDHGVEVHIFERKGDYQSFISQYGLFESEWEIIRGINKTEGHVRTYFENNYKTGRKVVEDLLIEEIIQKSFNNQIGNNADEDGMAKTLMDIKDKIIELSRKKDEISVFDRQIALMEELSEKILSFKDYQGEKERLKNQLLNKLAVCRKLTDDLTGEIAADEEKKVALEAKLLDEEKDVAIARLIDDDKELSKLQALVTEYGEKIAALVAEEDEVNSGIRMAECVESYREMKKYEGLKEEVMLAMDNRMRDNGDVYGEIRALAAKAHELVAGMQADYEVQLKNAKEALEKMELEYNRIKGLKEENDIKAAVSEGRINSVAEQIVAKEATLKSYVNDCGVLVADQVYDEIEKTRAKVVDIAAKIQLKEKEDKDLKAQLEQVRGEAGDIAGQIKVLSYEENVIQKDLDKSGNVKDKLNALAAVYGESEAGRLTSVIYNMYKNSIREIADVEIKLNAMREYLANLSEGRYVLDGRQYAEVEDYLFNTYGEDVMYGYQWYQTLTPAQQRDVAKRIPFLDYSFVILGDFERIREDANLRNFSHSSYIVPVISEMILRDTRHAASADYIVFGTKDLSFLMDPNKVAAEIDGVKNDIFACEDSLKKLKMKQGVFWEDYLYMQNISGKEARGSFDELEKIQRQVEAAKKKLAEIRESEERLKKMCMDVDGAIASLKADLADKEKHVEKLLKTADINDEIRELYSQKKNLQEEHSKARAMQEQYGNAQRKAFDELEAARAQAQAVQDSLSKVGSQWKDIFEPYYSDKVSPVAEDIAYEQLLIRFNGLVNVVNNENADVSDKKTLIKAYEENIEKAVRFMEGAGFSVEEIAAKADDLQSASDNKLLKERLLRIKEELNGLRRENESQNAQMNRMEGSMAHARGIIEEKFGEFEIFECDNPRQFIQEHTDVIKAIRQEMKELESQARRKNKQLSDMTVIDRDIERMLKNSGVVVPEEIKAGDEAAFADLDGYELIQKDYDKLIRSEYKKKEEFNKEKRKITDMLKECNAFDLADEVERSIEIPDSVAEIEEMADNIKDTCECIVLEKDRISKGIDDMERIKESFENRCIQTCANIKAELDRLPKLSKITLDNEVISMIGLSIPYVKEEFYKERMSAYINDTVAFTESFKSDEERIQYIKNRLSWKKLFSVIVTDMNSIRLNLYKRERIKDQSRYLRYEEAVGSTGQSQGIYIQFLIAIINYISNINAAGKEVSAIGKVVFIDNPFGAAKDIYIWEPIFKLLKTNHVQLIVPARGATPAITGRFDVNYILGQKMVNGRQQTVVVDYRSQVQNEVMEYTRLEYSQESLF